MLEAKTITKEEYERLVSGASFSDMTNMPLDNGIKRGMSIHSKIQNVLPKTKCKSPVKVGTLTSEEYQKFSSHHSVVYTTSPIADAHIARAISARQKRHFNGKLMEKITQKYKNLQDGITSHCIIMAGHKNPSELKELRYCETDQALWDTGATNTIISTEIAEELHLTPIKKSAISGIGGLVNSNVYRVNLYFGKKVRFENIEVLASDLEDCHLIIGMDLINKGDFAITNKDGETWFSFRIPSQEHLEFD